MKTINVKSFFNGVDMLSTRESGAILRDEIRKHIENNIPVILDFEGINMITQSFADEIVGIFIREYGVNFAKSRIKIKNANELVKTIIKFVISYSKKVA